MVYGMHTTVQDKVHVALHKYTNYYFFPFDTKMKMRTYSTNLNEIKDDMFDTEAFCRDHKPVRMEDIQEHRIAVG